MTTSKQIQSESGLLRLQAGESIEIHYGLCATVIGFGDFETIRDGRTFSFFVTHDTQFTVDTDTWNDLAKQGVSAIWGTK